MSATIITVEKVGASGTNIVIKVNDGHPVPSQILSDTVESFRTWKQEDGHIFVWTNDQGDEMSMTVPFATIGWILCSSPKSEEAERFRINVPCRVSFVEEVPPA